MQRRDGDQQLLGEGTWPAAADADLEAVRADVLTPVGQRGQLPQPSIVSPVTRRPSHAASPSLDPAPSATTEPAPLVAEPHRVGRMPLVQVGHLAGEELDVGAAHAHALDFHDHLSRPGDGRRDLLDRHATERSPRTTYARGEYFEVDRSVRGEGLDAA